MDRFVTREPRNDREYLQQHENRMMAYPSNASNTQNNFMPLDMYHGGYGAEFPGSGPMQHGSGRFSTMNMSGMGGMGATGGAGGGQQLSMPLYASTPIHPDQTQVVSGINQEYLAAYADTSETIIAGQQRMQNEHSNCTSNQHQMTTGLQRMQNEYSNYSPNQHQIITGQQRMHNEHYSNYNPSQHQMVTGNYNYRSFSGPDGNKTLLPQMVATTSQPPQINQLRREETNQSNSSLAETQKSMAHDSQNNLHLTLAPNLQDVSQKAPVKQSTEVSFFKRDNENRVKTRFDKLKELHRAGPRAFSGTVENVLKWHKSLQDLGVFIIYEVVAKCVSVRQGDWCSKNLVIRDDQGPAMQVVYYEIDFLLPELKTPCTIRVVGRMVAGTSRLHAFNVRAAAGDDVAALPRRAAVAAHHVARLCSQYTSNTV